jgi:hypothetical protein
MMKNYKFLLALSGAFLPIIARMKTDSIEQFVALRQSLVAEKASLEKRLKEISAALAGHGAVAAPAIAPAIAPAPAPAPKARRGGRRKRIANALSLKEAVVKATAPKALTKPEILKAVLASGYKFATSNPMNSINVVLYGRNPKFANKGGKFSPIK